MNATGEDFRNDLLQFARSLSKEQADNIMRSLPQVIALLEEPMPHYLQELFLRTG